MHPIFPYRMTGSSAMQFEAFHRRFGREVAKKVTVTTTKWLPSEQDSGQLVEEQLKETLWKDMLAEGAHCARLDDTPDSATDLLRDILHQYHVLQLCRPLDPLPDNAMADQNGQLIRRHTRKPQVHEDETIKDSAQCHSTSEERFREVGLYPSITPSLADCLLLSCRTEIVPQRPSRICERGSKNFGDELSSKGRRKR